MKPDPRLNAFRPDLADSRLRGQVKAEQFVEGKTARVIEPRLGLRSRPEMTASYTTEALLGDCITVFERRDGWGWGQMEKDSYVGYFPLSGISDGKEIPTHRICVPATFVYPKANLKSQPAIRVFLNSLLTVMNFDGDWAELNAGGFIFRNHICPADQY
ncbi:MAG TPA: peptidase P60, partial [Rhizobiales bacterium]|nr:peptidase P60 [Hyphomicrobiales bacterium]